MDDRQIVTARRAQLSRMLVEPSQSARPGLRLAIVAHDRTRLVLADWARRRHDVLSTCELFCTGETADALIERCPELPVFAVGGGSTSGSRRIGVMIAEGRLDGLIFFVDPMAASRRETDVDVLTRLAIAHDLPMACSARTADLVLESLARNGLGAETLAVDTPVFGDLVISDFDAAAARHSGETPSAESRKEDSVRSGGWPRSRKPLEISSPRFVQAYSDAHADGIEAERRTVQTAARSALGYGDFSDRRSADLHRRDGEAQRLNALSHRPSSAASSTRRFLMIVGEGVPERQVRTILRTLVAEGHFVDVVSPGQRQGETVRTAASGGGAMDHSGRGRGVGEMMLNYDFDDVAVAAYDGLILPAGLPSVARAHSSRPGERRGDFSSAGAPWRDASSRQHMRVVSLVQAFQQSSKPMGAFGAGVRLLADADAVRGRRIAAEAMDVIAIKAAGGDAVSREGEIGWSKTVVDDGTVTAQAGAAIEEWLRAFLKVVG